MLGMPDARYYVFRISLVAPRSVHPRLWNRETLA